jgi:hypothetical protein
MTYRAANWDAPLPKAKPLPSPMTAARFRYLSSLIGNGEISQSMMDATFDRRQAGREPLPPHHPITRAALPKLLSLG